MTTYSTNSTNCTDFPEWKECGCAIEQGAGYDNTDGVHTYCVGTVKYLVESLTDDKNCDDPLEGSRKGTPTWSIQTYADFVGGKQDPLADGSDNPLPEGTQVVTHAEFDAAAATTATAIASRQAPLLSCAGNALPANTRVPTCDEMTNAIANVDTVAPYALRDCDGAALANNALVASCDDLAQGLAAVTGQNLRGCDGELLEVGTQVPTCTEFDMVEAVATANAEQHTQSLLLINAKQDQLQDCSGDDLAADTQVVTCAKLSDDFEIDTATGNISLNTCMGEPPVLSGACEIIPTVYVRGDDGCWSLAALEEGSNDLTSVGANEYPGADTAETDIPLAGEVQGVDYYHTIELAGDVVNGTVDQAKLDKYKLQCMTFTLTCESKVSYTVSGVGLFNPETPAVTRIIFSVDGALQTSPAGFAAPLDMFTSFERSFSGTVNAVLSAGTHTICTYAIAEDADRPMVGMRLLDIGARRNPLLEAAIRVT